MVDSMQQGRAKNKSDNSCGLLSMVGVSENITLRHGICFIQCVLYDNGGQRKEWPQLP